MIRDIEVQEAHALIQENTGNPNFVVLDVRTPNEFREGRLSGATLLDFHSSQFDNQLQQLDREKRYLVYCATGGRSAQVVKQMVNLEFANVYHMPVGLRGWVAANLNVETDDTGPSPWQG
jgi:rhodanese-related sulfurtransferase